MKHNTPIDRWRRLLVLLLYVSVLVLTLLGVFGFPALVRLL